MKDFNKNKSMGNFNNKKGEKILDENNNNIMFNSMRKFKFNFKLKISN
jgi:hypothetical protein